MTHIPPHQPKPVQKSSKGDEPQSPDNRTEGQKSFKMPKGYEREQENLAESTIESDVSRQETSRITTQFNQTNTVPSQQPQPQGRKKEKHRKHEKQQSVQSATSGRLTSSNRAHKQQGQQQQQSGQQGQAPVQQTHTAQSSSGPEQVVGAQGSQGAHATHQVQEVMGLIQGLVETMQVGKLGGKDLVKMTLSGKEKIPDAFKGASLSLTAEGKSVHIKFEQLADPNMAKTLIKENEKALRALIETLAQKGINVKSFQMDGANMLPQQVLPKPFEVASSPLPGRRESMDEEGEKGGSDTGGENDEDTR